MSFSNGWKKGVMRAAITMLNTGWLKTLVFRQGRYRKFSGVCAWRAYLRMWVVYPRIGSTDVNGLLCKIWFPSLARGV
jgi:hypothetical protein